MRIRLRYRSGPTGSRWCIPIILARGIRPYLGQGDVVGVSSAPFAFDTNRSFEIYTAEIQQILQSDQNLIVGGGRLQTGKFETQSNLSLVRPNFSGGFSTPAAPQRTEADFQRMTIYGYDYWNATKDLTLIKGFRGTGSNTRTISGIHL